MAYVSPGVKSELSHPCLIKEAINDLECQLTTIFEEGPSRQKLDAAFAILESGRGGNLTVYRKRFMAAILHESYDPATRFRASESALELIKQQFGLKLF